MSNYTIQVRWIVESSTMNDADKPLLQRIDLACPKIFDFSFPIWNEEYRLTLERKIIMRYLNKEIGLETVALWKLYLNERLNSIMPYYNNLYATTVKDYDYLADTIFSEGTVEAKVKNGTDVKAETDTKTETNVTTGALHSESDTEQHDTQVQTYVETGTTLNSDLPQTSLNGLDYGTLSTSSEGNTTQNITSNSTNDNTVDQDTTANSTINGTLGINSTLTINETNDNTVNRNKTGASGVHTLNSMLKEYRDNLLNIDNMIIRELHDLFMLIY